MINTNTKIGLDYLYDEILWQITNYINTPIQYHCWILIGRRYLRIMLAARPEIYYYLSKPLSVILSRINIDWGKPWLPFVDGDNTKTPETDYFLSVNQNITIEAICQNTKIH